MNSKSSRERLALAGILLGLVASAGCGGGGNDQGVVFRAVGIFRGEETIEEDRITCVSPTVDTNIVDTSYSLLISRVIDFPNRTQPIANPCGGWIALENGLSVEAFNVEEISIRYEVPGALVQVPPHSVSIGQTIPPASSDLDTASGAPNVIFAQLVGQIVPRPIIIFMNQNAARLPVPPYLMNVYLVARGQADDGTSYESNEIGYQLTILG